MPGVFGWIDLGRTYAPETHASRTLLDEMAHRMCHNGSEQVERWTDPGGRFAVGRIALPGHATPPWPTVDAAGQAVAFAEGALEDEHLHDLACRDLAALPSVRGSFTAARWDGAAHRLTLAVDRRASRPLAYTLAGSRLYFAPEVKALLAAPGADKSIDEAAVGLFLGSGYMLGHQTLFAAIRRLSGGEAIVAEPGRVRVEVYRRHRLRHPGDGTPADELEEELAGLVRSAVEHDLGDPEEAVVFLSGGVDSRSIAAVAQAAARRQGKRIRTVTWAAPGSEVGSDREVAFLVAQELGTRHQDVVRRVTAWGRRLVETTYLLDGLTDVPAYHPYEHAVMGELAASGARTVLRGDECFGWEQPVASVEEAWLSLNLRSPRALRYAGRVLHPAALARLSAAAEAALAEAARPLQGEHPDDTKDLLYFRHRLQGYLGSAAYLKQVVLDHRAPLVDDALLDFQARVPAALRAHKGLFLRAARRLAPELFRIPLAHGGNLEDWPLLLASRSPVRRHVEAELADGKSGLWEMFDPEGLFELLPPLGRPEGRGLGAWAMRRVKGAAKHALRLAPAVERRARVRAHRAGLRFDQLCLRVMVLKAWHDLFVTGDGSRRALAERLARAG